MSEVKFYKEEGSQYLAGNKCKICGKESKKYFYVSTMIEVPWILYDDTLYIRKNQGVLCDKEECWEFYKLKEA